MLSEKLKQAISMIKAGEKLAARKLLVEILDGEPTNETAWLWFTDTLSSDTEKKIALEGLLKINPTSQAAKLGLERLAARKSVEEPVVVEDDRAEEKSPEDYRPIEMDLDDGFPVDSDSVEFDDTPTAQKSAGPYAPVEHDAVLEEPEGIFLNIPAAPASDAVAEQSGRPAADNLTETDGTPAAGTAPAPAAAPASPPVAAAAAPSKFTLPTGFARIGIILAAFIVIGGAIYLFGSMLGLFDPVDTTCKCAQTDAYLLRVNDRVTRCMNNQALYILAENHGDAPQNTDFAQQLVDEENKENVPVCLKDLHDTLLTTFENQVKYGIALQSKDSKQIQYYRSVESGMQDQLKQEMTIFKCNP